MTDAANAMDRMYRPQVAIYDLSRKFYLLGRDGLIEGLAPTDGDHVLEIGCGTGRNLVRAAHLYPRSHFYGVDISEVMLARARTSISRSGNLAPIALAKGDAASFDAAALFGQDQFERIFVSYALSMIPRWQETIEHALDLLGPRGSLHIVDFGDCGGLPSAFRGALQRWLAIFHVTPQIELQRVLSAKGSAGGLVLGHRALYRGYALYSVLSR